MRNLTRLASRIVMFFMQFYYRLARHSRVSYKAYIDGRTRLAGYNTIQDNVLLAGARIGRGTYICRGSNFTDAEVGAFCSIGRNVRIVNGQHPTRTFVSTHPAFFSPNGQPGFSFVREKRYEDCRYLDREQRVVDVGDSNRYGGGDRHRSRGGERCGALCDCGRCTCPGNQETVRR